jgi:hypothetical protein
MEVTSGGAAASRGRFPSAMVSADRDKRLEILAKKCRYGH